MKVYKKQLRKRKKRKVKEEEKEELIMNKEEYKAYIEEQYKDDPEGNKIFLKMLFEFLIDQILNT